jgi:hypothetical protein
MLCKDGVHRFPRESANTDILKKFTGHKMQRLAKQFLAGKVPVRYDKLTKKQKKVARAILAGSTVKEAAKRFHMDGNTFYRWLHFHPLFQAYYYRKAHEIAGTVDARLDAKLPRAVRVVEEALDSNDKYFAHDSAIALLKGRGKYATNSKVKTEHTGHVKFDTGKEVARSGIDKETLLTLVDALVGRAQGGKTIEAKIINVKELPPAVIEGLPHGTSEVQESNSQV